jgi:hypothetical protein
MQATIRSRTVWLFAIVLLLAALTLSACGAPARSSGGNNNGSAGSGQTTQTQAAPDIQDLQSADQDMQDITSALQSISSDASTDYSSQDFAQQP